jgi:hypothetical protein
MRHPASHYQGTGIKEAVCHKGSGLLSKGVLLLHNNARPHIAYTTVKFLNTWHWEILPHSPRSPDMAPLDSRMFVKLKNHLKGLYFQTDEDVEEEVK